MRHIPRPRLLASTILLLASAASSTAAAQGLPLNRFDAAPAGERMFNVASPVVEGHLAPQASLLFDYAKNPLTLESDRGSAGAGNVVSDQLYMHVGASLPLWERVSVNLALPVALVQSGSANGNGQVNQAAGRAELGDLRAGLRLRMYGEPNEVFQAGLGTYLWLPTAPADGGYVGGGQVRGMAQLLLGGRTDRMVWSFAAGPKFQGTQTYAGVTHGTELDVGAGVGFLPLANRRLQIGPEIYGAFTLARDAAAVNDSLKRASNIEILADARYALPADVEVGLGVGPGLTMGLGTPSFRGVVMATYRPGYEESRSGKPKHGDDGEVTAKNEQRRAAR